MCRLLTLPCLSSIPDTHRQRRYFGQALSGTRRVSIGHRAMTSLEAAAELPDLTVLICTRDRPESLALTLDLLARQDLCLSRFEEVLVVDNSEAGTARSVVDDRSSILRVRSIQETRPGKWYALNAGLAASGLAPVIAVLDDDMSPGEDYCRRILEVCERWPDAGVFAASIYPIPPEGMELPAWVSRRGVIGWALSSIEYHGEGPAAPGHYLSGGHFWFRRAAAGGRVFPEFWAPEAHFTLGLVEDGVKAIVAEEPRCGHRVQPELLQLDVQRRRAVLTGSHLPKFRLDFPRTVPQARFAAQHPILWKLRCLGNLCRWAAVMATVPMRRGTNRVTTELIARVAIANNIACLRHRRAR